MEKSFHCLITLMAIASLALAAATNQDDSPKKKGMYTYYYHGFFETKKFFSSIFLRIDTSNIYRN